MNLENYVQVSDRLLMALERYPELRVVEEDPMILDWPGQTVLLCKVTVYREPGDPCPVIAAATEAIPGKTPYTKGSELMVGNTSALGRALGYMGFGIKTSIASKDEVQAARERQTPRRIADDLVEAATSLPEASDGTEGASGAQLRMLKALGFTGPLPRTKRDASSLIDTLKKANGE